jgi:transposase
MGLSSRQVRRVLKRYQESGRRLESLAYQRRHPSWNALPDSTKEDIRRLHREYPHWSAPAIAEALAATEGVVVDRATVHRLLRREAGNALPRHRRPARRFEMRAFALTEAGVRFAKQAYALYDGYLSSLYADRALTSMLDRNFYDLVNQLYFGATATALVDGDLVEFVRRAYATLSTLRGYYLLRPLLLVSNLNALESEVGHFMEYAAAVEALERTYQAGRERLGFSIDRFATDYQVRLLD